MTFAVNNFRFNESPLDLLRRASEAGVSEDTAREWGDWATRAVMPPLRINPTYMSSVSQAQYVQRRLDLVLGGGPGERRTEPPGGGFGNDAPGTPCGLSTACPREVDEHPLASVGVDNVSPSAAIPVLGFAAIALACAVVLSYRHPANIASNCAEISGKWCYWRDDFASTNSIPETVRVANQDRVAGTASRSSFHRR